MAMEPKILVLDEPAAGLDPERAAIHPEPDPQLRADLQHHGHSGQPLVEDIARYANRVLVMSKAKVAMYDTVEKVFARTPELLELGLSVPQVIPGVFDAPAMGMEIDTDVYTVPYAIKTVLKTWNAKHPDRYVHAAQTTKPYRKGRLTDAA